MSGIACFTVGCRDSEKKDWQTVVYDCKPIIRYDADNELDLTPVGEKPKPGAIQVFSSAASIPKTDFDGYAVLVGPDYEMENSFEEAVLSVGLSPLPPGSLVYYATGDGAAQLRAKYKVRGLAQLETDPEFTPITDSHDQQYPLMVNPNNPDVQRYEISIVQEVVRNYPVDGVIYDDRFRYGGINADFSDVTRELFEQHVGKKLTVAGRRIQVHAHTFVGSRYSAGTVLRRVDGLARPAAPRLLREGASQHQRDSADGGFGAVCRLLVRRLPGTWRQLRGPWNGCRFLVPLELLQERRERAAPRFSDFRLLLSGADHLRCDVERCRNWKHDRGGWNADQPHREGRLLVLRRDRRGRLHGQPGGAH